MNNPPLESITEIKISLHPNPVTDCVQISGIEGTAFLKISNLHCVPFINKEIIGDEIVCLKKLPKGIYIAKIIYNNKIVEKKLVKK